MNAAQYICTECGKTHKDGDPIEIVRGRNVIRVACMSHAVWARRHLIKDLLDSWKLAPGMVAAFERCKEVGPV